MYKKIFSIFILVLVVSMGFVLAAPNNSQQGNSTNAIAASQQTQDQNRVRVQDGTHMGERGQMFKIQTQANNRMRLEVEGISAECDCEMKQEKVDNKTKLSTILSNGKNAEIKIMPNTASEKALKALKLSVCSEENECKIELKEIGSGEQTKLAYELKTQRRAKVFGLFKSRRQVQAQVDAENGEVIKVKKPWWSFLASEPIEEAI